MSFANGSQRKLTIPNDRFDTLAQRPNGTSCQVSMGDDSPFTTVYCSDGYVAMVDTEKLYIEAAAYAAGTSNNTIKANYT